MNHSSPPLGLQYDLVDCIGYNWLTKYSNWNETYVSHTSFIKGSPSILKFERFLGHTGSSHQELSSTVEH